jgi:hypothetical protein
MSFLQNLSAQVHVFAANFKTALGGFFHKVRQWVGEQAIKLHSRMQPLVDRLLERLSPEKRRLVLIATMGVSAVLVLILAISSVTGKTSERNVSTTETALVRQGIIPPDELFLPDEPDFVPGVMLGREQRTAWTAGDADALWQDPLKNGEEPWRNRVEEAVDAIMESVP